MLSAIQTKLTKKANVFFDVEVNGKVVKFKLKKYKTAWVKYEYPTQKQLLKSLFDMAKNKYPKMPNWPDY